MECLSSIGMPFFHWNVLLPYLLAGFWAKPDKSMSIYVNFIIAIVFMREKY